MSIQADASTRTDEASLGDLFIGILNFYIKLGRMILLIALLFALPVAIWIASHPIYQITALLDAPGLELDRWRQIEPLLTDKSLIQTNLEKNLAGSDEALRQQLAQRFSSAAFWSNNVRYRSSLRRDDIQEAPSIDLRNASTLGLELSIRVHDEAQAGYLQQAMISQIREAIVLEGARSLIHEWQKRLIEERPKLQLKLFDKKLATQLNRTRIEDMKRLLERYPELRNAEPNTVVSVRDGGGRFLSPLAQIVALESTISEDASLIKTTEHELERLGFYEQVITNIDDPLLTIRSGHQLTQQLQTRANLLQESNPSSLAATEVRLDVLSQAQALLGKPQQLQLKATADLPSAPVISRNPVLAGVLAFIAAFFGSSILLALYQLIRQQSLPPGSDWQPAQDPFFTSLPRKPRQWLLGNAATPSGERS